MQCRSLSTRPTSPMSFGGEVKRQAAIPSTELRPAEREGSQQPGDADRPVRMPAARDFGLNIERVRQACHRRATLTSTPHALTSSRSRPTDIHHLNGSHMWFPGFDVNPRSFMSVEAVDVLWFEQAELIQEGHMEL